jgi:hypothetical protein
VFPLEVMHALKIVSAFYRKERGMIRKLAEAVILRCM